MTIEVKTMTAGNLWKVLVKPGDTVSEGDTLFIMEVMKMEVNHDAPAAGTVTQVLAGEGAEGLEADQTVIIIS